MNKPVAIVSTSNPKEKSQRDISDDLIVKPVVCLGGDRTHLLSVTRFFFNEGKPLCYYRGNSIEVFLPLKRAKAYNWLHIKREGCVLSLKRNQNEDRFKQNRHRQKTRHLHIPQTWGPCQRSHPNSPDNRGLGGHPVAYNSFYKKSSYVTWRSFNKMRSPHMLDVISVSENFFKCVKSCGISKKGTKSDHSAVRL